MPGLAISGGWGIWLRINVALKGSWSTLTPEGKWPCMVVSPYMMVDYNATWLDSLQNQMAAMIRLNQDGKHGFYGAGHSQARNKHVQR